MTSKAEAREALAKAREITRTCEREYKRTWKAHPTAAGFPKVDKALAALHAAEAAQRAAERQLAEAW